MTTTPSRIHADTSEALAVSSSLIGRDSGGYGREAHLLLSRPSVWETAGGSNIQPDATPRDAFRIAGADFTVESRSLRYDRSGDPEGGDFLSDWSPVRSHKAIIRTDTSAVLGVVGRNYHPIQNEELIRLFEYLREDAEIQNIITLNGGAKVVATASISLEAEVKEGDTIRRYLHAFNGHDGGTALGVFFSDLRLVCANQLRYITGRGSKRAATEGEGIRARHTAGGAALAKRLPELIDLQQQRFRKEVEQLKPLTTCRLSAEAAEYVLEQTFKDKLAVPIKVERGGSETRDRTLDDLPEVDVIRSHFGRGTGIGIDTADRSVWNLLQATTQWATHDAGRATDDTERARVRLEQLWGGTLSQRIDRCTAACLEVAGVA